MDLSSFLYSSCTAADANAATDASAAMASLFMTVLTAPTHAPLVTLVYIAFFTYVFPEQTFSAMLYALVCMDIFLRLLAWTFAMCLCVGMTYLVFHVCCMMTGCSNSLPVFGAVCTQLLLLCYCNATQKK